MATLEDLGFKPPTRLYTWPTAGAPSLRLVLLRELAEHVADGPHGRAPRPFAESVATVARWLASRSGVALYLRSPGTEYAAIADDSTVFAQGIRFDQLPASLRFTLGSTAQPPADDESAGDGTAADTFASLLKARKQSAAKPAPLQWLGRIQGQAPALRCLVDCPPAAATSMPQWALRLASRADLVAEFLAELCPPAQAEACAAAAKSSEAMPSATVKAGKTWAPEQLAAMFRARHLEGMTDEQIAKRYGFGTSRVGQLIGSRNEWKNKAWKGGSQGWKPSAALLIECKLMHAAPGANLEGPLRPITPQPRAA